MTLSPFESSPLQCAYYDADLCRSCTELAVPYQAQLRAKQLECRLLLSAHPQVEWLPSVPSPQAGFRNKAKMVVSGTHEHPLLGIRNERGIAVDLSDCPLYPPAMQRCFPVLAQLITAARIEPYDVAGRRGELKFVLLTLAEHSGELMVRFVLRSQEPIARIRKHLPELLRSLPELRVVSANLQPEHKAVLEGSEEILLTSQEHVAMRLNGIDLYLRPQSFFQTNSYVAAALYAQVREWTCQTAPHCIWDLYCGVGGFALHVADCARDVVGVESSPEAIASAELSRTGLGLINVRFETGDATEFALRSAHAPDLVIVNPPRRGIGAELCAWLQASTVRTLVYSSCNAETLARDLAAMPRFALRQARVLDMFPHTRHYEVVTLLEDRDQA